MSIITTMLKQKAVYWAVDTPDEYGSNVLSTPIEISCRWEDKGEEFIDSSGRRQISNSMVYVDQDVDLGGMLWLGELDDCGVAPPDPTIHEIRKFEKTPNLRATQTLRLAIL